MCRRMIYLISLVVVLSMAGGASADLVAHWPFDEGSGTITHDASGNGHDGSFEGSPQWTRPGWNGIGWSLQFGGDNDRLTVESFDLTGSGITLAAWINVTIFQDDARLISKSEGSGTPDHYWAMILSGSGEATLCSASGGFHISTKISCPGSSGTSLLVCGQSINIYFSTFF